ncbi:MAG: hypothetical protein K9N48_01825 [Verrucomicrobia bacterium]|nr:hypothetical protein [Verrucomicrobiota bacterium]MCF7709081.1 hypothetical protein [Verrucomicrobiota bacterium]
MPLTARSDSSQWRIFSATDGLPESRTLSVSITPAGDVLAKHAEAKLMSRLNGYSITWFESPGPGYLHVYQDTNGWIWSIYGEGIQVLRGHSWEKFPIESIHTEMTQNPIRRVRPIPIVPVGNGTLLFLIGDRLMAFNVDARQSRVVAEAAQHEIGKWSDMRASKKGGAWITGENGWCKVTAQQDEVWNQPPRIKEYILAGDSKLTNIRSPIENSSGALTMVADSTASGERVILHATNPFEPPVILNVGNLKIRNAWPDGNGGFWTHSISRIFHLNSQGEQIPFNGGFQAGLYYDVAVGNNNVFWLATSEGLAMHTPTLWQTIRSEGLFDTSLYAVIKGDQNGLWFSQSSSLVNLKDDSVGIYPYPNEAETFFQPFDHLYMLPDGRLAVTTAESFFLFDPSENRFSKQTHPASRNRRVIGQDADKSLFVLDYPDTPTDESVILKKFDGDSYSTVFEPETASERLINARVCCQADNGKIWVGGPNGVSVINNGKLEEFDPNYSDTPRECIAIMDIPDGSLWVAERTRISSYDGKKWRIVKSGFDRITTMDIAGDGSVWVGTGSGLFRYYTNSWVSQSIQEGLPGETVYGVCTDYQNRVWAATSRGAAKFFPSTDIDPPVTEVRNKPGANQFDHGKPFRIYFDGRDKWNLTPTHRLLYSHRIDDGNWSEFNESPYVLLTNITAGNHMIEVRAMDRNWNFDTTPASWEFVVQLPWYKETRLVVISSLGMIIIIALAVLAVNRHLRLVKSYAEIELKIQQRTQELENAYKELLHSQKMRALGTLAAGIAHDFNNILSIIKGSAQIIKAHPDDRERILKRTGRILSVVEQATGIVKAMLGYSRPSQQAPTRCQVNDLVHDTIRLLGDRFTKEIQIKFEPDQALPKVAVIKDLLQQILLNLLFNAADAVHGNGTITLRTGLINQLPDQLVLQPDKDDKYVTIEVQDNGNGIPPEIMSRIFEPFFTTKSFSQKRGTGLGLSMVYEFSKALAYGLNVESYPDKGTVFTIYIPVNISSALPEALEKDESL